MFNDFLPTLAFAFGVTGPIFLMVFLGALFKRWQMINDNFIDIASRLVFNVTLPALLFLSIIKTDLNLVLNVKLILLACVGTLLIFLLLSWWAALMVNERRDRGVFVQGGFRGNLGIVGLAFSVNAFGAEGMAVASVLMALMTILYNVLSVYTLNHSLAGVQTNSLLPVLSGIIKNPLIVAIAAALLLSLLEIQFHQVITDTGEYFAKMTLPLALLCIGGTLSLSTLRESSAITSMAVLAKLVLTPLLLVSFAYVFEIRGVELGVLFLLAASPTAAASYVMVQSMKGNAAMAASMVVLSTLGSLVTVSLGLALLKSLGLV